MKNRKFGKACRTLLVISCLLAAVWTGGCTADEELSRPVQEQAALTLRISHGNVYAEDSDPDLWHEKYESKLHELRIILFPKGGENDRTHNINAYFTEEEMEAHYNHTNGCYELPVSQVPVGEMVMYAIANEKSLGRNYTDETKLESDKDAVSGKVVIQDSTGVYFPIRRRKETDADNRLVLYGLPMTASDTVKVRGITDGTQAVDIELRRAVSKLELQMVNTTDSVVRIDAVTFGKFFADRLVLFTNRLMDVLPYTKYRKRVSEDLNILVPGKGMHRLVLYIYPTEAWKGGDTQYSPYTVGMKVQNEDGSMTWDYEEMAFTDPGNDNQPLGAIVRNQHIRIKGRMLGESNIEIKFDVEPWTTDEVDVPGFN